MSKLYVKNKIVVDHTKLEKVKCEVSPANRKGNPLHDKEKPIFYWFQDTPLGKEIFLVLYTKKCAWARCSFCSLPSVSSPFDVERNHIAKQADYVFDELTEKQLSQVKRLFISNNGSVLDQETMPSVTLDTICQLGYSKCSSLEIITFETRIQAIEKSELIHYLRNFQSWHEYNFKHGSRKVDSPVKLQISIGYETQDPYIRNDILCKGYPESYVQNFFKLCSDVYKETGEKILCDFYVLTKPINGKITDEEAIAESAQTIIHLNELGEYFNVPVSVRLNPTFVAEGSYLHKKFLEKSYTPPTFKDVIMVLRKAKNKNLKFPIFIGLSDEDLAFYGGSFNRDTEVDYLYLEALRKFNKNQDYECLEHNIDIIEKYLRSPLGQLTAATDSVSLEMAKILGDSKKINLRDIDYFIRSVEMTPTELKKIIKSADVIVNSLRKIRRVSKKKAQLHR